jgi:psp operon transcriptional activator
LLELGGAEEHRIAGRDRHQFGAVSDLRAAVDAYERQILSDTMARCRFNQKVAAEALGLSYDQIRHALKKHGLNN